MAASTAIQCVGSLRRNLGGAVQRLNATGIVGACVGLAGVCVVDRWIHGNRAVQRDRAATKAVITTRRSIATGIHPTGIGRTAVRRTACTCAG